MTALYESLHGVKNLSMAVEERGNGITFLYKVVPIPADRSYVIEVARLAGIPDAVLRRSVEILERLEKREYSVAKTAEGTSSLKQLPLWGGILEDIVCELAEIDPDEMTPLGSLERLYLLKSKAMKALDSR